MDDSSVVSKLLNPEYLFERGLAAIRAVYDFFAGIPLDKVSDVFNFFLFAYAVFFIIIIFYSIIRLLEIRKKEHAHLEHEIEEYAHKHPELHS